MTALRQALQPVLFRVGLAIIYFIVARYSLNLAFAATSVSPIWPPSGIALVGILLLGYRAIPFIFVAAFCANLFNLISHQVPIHSVSLLSCAAIGAGNTFEAVTGAYLLRRWIGVDALFNRFQAVFYFALLAALAGLASAIPGVLSLIWSGVIPAVAWKNVLGTWWIGDVCGILVVTPLLLCAWQAWLARKPWLPWYENVGLTVILAGLLFVIFSPAFRDSHSLLLLLLFPVIAWAAWRDGARGVTLCVMLVVTVAIGFTLQAKGPFAEADLNSSLIALDSFVAMWCIGGLALAADLCERQQLQHGARGRTLLVPWLALLLGVSLATLAWHYAQQSRREISQAQFNELSAEFASNTIERLHSYETVLQGARGLFAANEKVTHDEWRRYVQSQRIWTRLPGVMGVNYIAYLPAASQSQFEREQRQIHPSFQFWPASAEPWLAPITFLEMAEISDPHLYGLDMYAESTRRAALIRARDTGQATISGKVKLFINAAPEMQTGFLFFIPIYQLNRPINSVAERQAALKGFVVSPFRIADFIAAVLGKNANHLQLSIEDGDSSLYANRSSTLHSDIQAQTIALALPNHQWQLHTSPSTAFIQQIDYQKERIILVAGLLISVLLFGLLRTLMLTHIKAVRLSETMAVSLKAVEAKFSSLVDASFEAIIIADQGGNIVSFNPGAEAMFGYRADDMLGQVLTELMPTRYRNSHLQGLARRVEQGKSSRFSRQVEVHALHQQGHEFPISLSLSSWHSDGVAFYGAIVNDLTQRKQVEADLESARTAAEAANQAKTAFLANMSHEIRTPLNAILGFASLLQDTPLNVHQHDYVASIASGGNVLLCQMNDLLDFSKIEAGKLEIECIDFDLRRTVNESLALVSTTAKNKQLALSCQFDSEIPSHLRGDPNRLRQILLNLLNNAVKFTDKGEISVYLRAEVLNEHEYRLEVSIKDTGIGISDDAQARLFQPFTQADSSTTRRFGGTGLGLSICKRLAEAMCGHIAVKSELHVGSTFTFDVILAPAETSDTANQQAPCALLAQDSSAEMVYVLLAEDNPINQKVATLMLEKLSCRVDVVSDGVAAIQAVAQNQYDMVFMDCQMPEMDGFVATETIRAMGREKSRVPIIALTANAFAEDIQHCRAAGMDDFLAKPVQLESLRVVIQKWREKAV